MGLNDDTIYADFTIHNRVCLHAATSAVADSRGSEIAASVDALVRVSPLWTTQSDQNWPGVSATSRTRTTFLAGQFCDVR